MRILLLALLFLTSPLDSAHAQLTQQGFGMELGGAPGRLLIVRVIPNSPADQAGLKAGDIIAFEVARNKHLSVWRFSEESVQKKWLALKKLHVGIIRKNSKKPFVVYLERGPVPLSSPVTLTEGQMSEMGAPGGHYLGFGLQLAEEVVECGDEERCLVLRGTVAGSDAARQGLRKGDQLQEVQHGRVVQQQASPRDLVRAAMTQMHIGAVTGEVKNFKLFRPGIADGFRVNLKASLVNDLESSTPCLAAYTQTARDLGWCQEEQLSASLGAISRCSKQLAGSTVALESADQCRQAIANKSNLAKLATQRSIMITQMKEAAARLKSRSSGILVGPQCEGLALRAGYSDQVQRKWRYGKDTDIALAVACADPGKRLAGARVLAHWDAAFPARQFDHGKAALLLAYWRKSPSSACKDSKSCAAAGNAAGAMSWYRDRLDQGRARTALQTAGVPKEVASLVVENAMSSEQPIKAILAKLSPQEHRVAVDALAEARRQSDAYYKRNEAHYAQLDTLLLSGRPYPEVSAELLKLRGQYLQHAGATEDRLKDVFVWDVTEAAIDLHLANGNTLVARAMVDQQRHPVDLSERIWAAQWKAFKAGAGPGLSSGRPDLFVAVGRATKATHKDKWVGLEHLVYKLKKVSRKGSVATIHFDTSWVEELENCRQTNRLESVSYNRYSDTFEGNYETHCRVVGKKKHKGKKLPPHTLPASEAAKLKRGVIVDLYCQREQHSCHLVEAYKRDKLIQWGPHAIKR